MASKTKKKNVQYCGQTEILIPETGELIPAQLTTIDGERDFNFHKVWMQSFLATLDILGTAKMKFACWLIEQMGRDNLIVMTYRKMEKESGISLGTIQTTMGLLLDADFIRKEANGVYRVNPEVVFKGDHNYRMAVLNLYRNAEYKPLTSREKLANLKSNRAELDKRIVELEQQVSLEEQKQPTRSAAISNEDAA